MKADRRKLHKCIVKLSDRMIKRQMKFRVEKSNPMCIEENYPNAYTVIWSFLVVVIRKEI